MAPAFFRQLLLSHFCGVLSVLSLSFHTAEVITMLSLKMNRHIHVMNTLISLFRIISGYKRRLSVDIVILSQFLLIKLLSNEHL